MPSSPLVEAPTPPVVLSTQPEVPSTQPALDPTQPLLPLPRAVVLPTQPVVPRLHMPRGATIPSGVAAFPQPVVLASPPVEVQLPCLQRVSSFLASQMAPPLPT